jgi:murein DD-endopeptidase MepM/ murein hydrolase activator NlpD
LPIVRLTLLISLLLLTFSVTAETTSSPKPVLLLQTGDKTRPEFFIRNLYPCPLEVQIDWGKHENISAEPDLPNRFVVASGDSPALFKVTPDQTRRSSQFSLSYRYIFGRPLSNYHSQYLYQPPIAPKARFRISQAFDGKFSHTDAQNRYAVDISMPLDTPVYAARAGIVIDVKDRYSDHGKQTDLASKANSIRILHDDSSMAVYAHLALEKAQVKAGMSVAAGQLIAYSGNTGYSSGPHLHFAVQINQGMELVSVPFEFGDETRRAIEPRFGEWLHGITP